VDASHRGKPQRITAAASCLRQQSDIVAARGGLIQPASATIETGMRIDAAP